MLIVKKGICMINMYAYTYPSAMKKYADKGFMLVKVGDSIRDVEVRKREQGGAAEWEAKVDVFAWNGLRKIKRDYQVHRVLTKRGLHNQEGLGTEWFKIPAGTVDEARVYLDTVITDLEHRKVRKSVKLRSLQQRKINEAISIVDKCGLTASIIANLCPRFGKTLWALSVFNELSAKYGNRIMLLPAYWLSVHSSFVNELDEYAEFVDIAEIDPNDANAEQLATNYLNEGMRIVIPISLHGDLEEWKNKHKWLTKYANNEFFNFADEGDFGTHTENQVEKLKYLFENGPEQTTGKFVSIYASGTNVQRLAKCSKQIDGVLYTAYSQLETTEPGMIRRKFYCLQVDTLKAEVEKLGAEVMPSWTKVNERPLANKDFITRLGQALLGYDSLHPELNLSAMTNEEVYCAMVLTSANKKEMAQIGNMWSHAMPDVHVKVLNGDYTTNRQAEEETAKEINEARIAGKKAVLILANAMGSRSYSIPEIQATVIAFDRGSVDATTQKVSRCLTPGNKYDGNKKDFGIVVDLSFDPNRAENIERIVLEEAIQLQRGGTEANDFTQAVKYVLSSVNMFKMNEYGYPVQVTEEDLFRVFGDNDTMLKVADVSVDITNAMESGLFDILKSVTAGNKAKSDKKAIVGEGVKNAVKVGNKPKGKGGLSDPAVKAAEKIINAAIHALNMSATSVFYLAEENCQSYRDCLNSIAKSKKYNAEFVEMFGVTTDNVIALLDGRALNEPILDVIVQNSKPKEVDQIL